MLCGANMRQLEAMISRAESWVIAWAHATEVHGQMSLSSGFSGVFRPFFHRNWMPLRECESDYVFHLDSRIRFFQEAAKAALKINPRKFQFTYAL